MQMSGLGETAQASGYDQPARGELSQREYADQFGQSYDAGSDYNKIYDKQAKSQEKATKEFLKSIERQYAEAQTAGTADLEKAKQTDLLKLSGLFNFANQDPDSGQRIQYEQRANNDYAGQLATLISKLSSAKADDVSGAKTALQKVLADIQNNRIAQQQKVADLQRQQQQQKFDNAYKIYGLKSGGGSYGTGGGEVDIFGNPING
jgi:hypothetical protein